MRFRGHFHYQPNIRAGRNARTGVEVAPTADIPRLIRSTVANGVIRPGNAANPTAIVFEQVFNSPVGVTRAGTAALSIRVVLDQNGALPSLRQPGLCVCGVGPLWRRLRRQLVLDGSWACTRRRVRPFLCRRPSNRTIETVGSSPWECSQCRMCERARRTVGADQRHRHRLRSALFQSLDPLVAV
jgi:hypothetical protein